jgi:hypothetical protein
MKVPICRHLQRSALSDDARGNCKRAMEGAGQKRTLVAIPKKKHHISPVARCPMSMCPCWHNVVASTAAPRLSLAQLRPPSALFPGERLLRASASYDSSQNGCSPKRQANGAILDVSRGSSSHTQSPPNANAGKAQLPAYLGKGERASHDSTRKIIGKPSQTS